MYTPTGIISFEISLYDNNIYQYLADNDFAYFIKDGDIYVAVPREHEQLIEQYINNSFKKSSNNNYDTCLIYYNRSLHSWVERLKNKYADDFYEKNITTMYNLSLDEMSKTFPTREAFKKWYYDEE